MIISRISTRQLDGLSRGCGGVLNGRTDSFAAAFGIRQIARETLDRKARFKISTCSRALPARVRSFSFVYEALPCERFGISSDSRAIRERFASGSRAVRERFASGSSHSQTFRHLIFLKIHIRKMTPNKDLPRTGRFNFLFASARERSRAPLTLVCVRLPK